MTPETVALILTPLVVGWGSWLTWLVSVRNNTQEDMQVLVGEHSNEIERLRSQLFERDRLAQETWTEMLQLRRMVLDLEDRLRQLHDQAMRLYGQLVDMGEQPVVKPLDWNHEGDETS